MQFNYKLYYEMWKTHKEMLKTNKTRHRRLSPYRVWMAETDVLETYSFRNALISSEAHLPDVSHLQKILIVGHHVLETCVLLSNWFTVNPVASPVTVPNSRVERLTLLFLTCRGMNCITDYVIESVKTISSFCCSLPWDFYLVVFQPHILFISNVVI